MKKYMAILAATAAFGMLTPPPATATDPFTRFLSSQLGKTSDVSFAKSKGDDRYDRDEDDNDDDDADDDDDDDDD
ncbi:hypothetical protein FE840_009655 [Peteryoungia desertarenae]|uniref:Uncharacterized protein n=1 Tax=Peteryoungia desertarenae TaxID=1813451 RepID=A0ABX6QMD9_9HYPH|nr:hypothetical protein [Peteryoungia desertarenae]QLF69788.1 hypothetical protein FE840_009655 [Peteryoungia desertarenae]